MAKPAKALSPNAFIGQINPPTDQELAVALGSAKALWDTLISELNDVCDSFDWNSYSKKAGWSLRLKRKDRVIVYLSPSEGSFRASFALGDRAIAATLTAKLPANIMAIIKSAKHYAEGSAVRIDVEKSSDVKAVKILAAIKFAN